MLDHHLQRDIVYQLAFADSLRFSELKPDGIESKLFTYHLKKVLAADFVIKNDDGTYSLTPEGRRIGVGAFRQHHMGTDRAYSILLLIIRKADGSWLLNRRNTHPLIDKVGFVHATPIATIDAPKRAEQECARLTGLDATFNVVGNGYLRMFEGDELESFTHFTLLACDDAKGDLQQNSEFAEFYWDTEPDFTASDMLPSMPTLYDLYKNPEATFAEGSFQL